LTGDGKSRIKIRIVEKKYLLAVLLAVTLSFPLFAYGPGDIVVNPEVQLGFEIPTIRQNADYPETYKDGNYVSLGLCWGLRLSLYYRLISVLSVSTGIGFEGVHNQYDFTYFRPGASTRNAYTERYTYDTYYVVIPAGLRAYIRALSFGAGVAGYIPVSAKFTGDRTLNSVHSPITDTSFKIDPFLGGYFDIGYDWAERDAKPRGFNMNLRVEASFSDKIAGGDADYNTFRHIAISLSAGYSFRAFRTR
jgi:hypothetical protein